jgi:hypothetical protein
MHSQSVETPEAFVAVEQRLEDRRPACRLIQQAAFRGTPSGYENAIQALLAAGDFVPALPVTVDLDARKRRQVGKDARLKMEMESNSWHPRVVAGPVVDPPTRHQLPRNAKRQ